MTAEFQLEKGADGVSTCITKEISCPNCGAVNKMDLWPGIDRKEKPLLRKKVLDESLFYWVCPHCGYRALMEYPCLYHDKELGFLLCLLPEGNGEVPGPLPPLPDRLKLRLVTETAQLKEKILLFESGYDDVAMELVKHSLTQLVVEKWHIPSAAAYFTRADEKEIEFAFFRPGQTRPVLQRTRMKAYRQAREILKLLHYRDEKGFVTVDGSLADQLFQRFHRLEQVED